RRGVPRRGGRTPPLPALGRRSGGVPPAQHDRRPVGGHRTVASIEFWGGLGVIGSSKIVVADAGHRVLRTLALAPPGGGTRPPPPVGERPDRALADRLRVGGAPRLPGLFDP